VSPEAWEASVAGDVFVRDPEATVSAERNLYLKLIRAAGVGPEVTVQASGGVWRATARSAEGRTLIALFPRASNPRNERVVVRYRRHEIAWDVRGAWPCLVVLDEKGEPLGATGGGRLRVNGSEVASGNGPWLLAALDGQPIRTTRRLAASMTFGGTLRLGRDAAKPSATIVETRDGRSVPVGQAAVRAIKRGWEVALDANDLAFVTHR